MTPSQKARYGNEVARNTKWRMAAPLDPPLKRPSGAPQPWPIRPHPAERAHRSNIPPPLPHLPLFHTRHAEESAERPRLVTIVRPSGQSELRKVTVLLNRRGVVSFEQLLLDISEALGFPRWHRGRVTRLYTTHAREVKGVCDFFRGEAAFLALGKTRPELSSVQDALEELFPEHSHYRANVLRAWEKKLRPVPNKAAKADSGYSEGTDSRGTNQETHRDTNPDVKNHDNAPVSQHTDTQQQENYNPDPQKSYKKISCRKPAHLPNNLQKLRVRGGVKDQQLSVPEPFKHSEGLRDTEIPSPILCENCLARRAKHPGPELISTLSGRVPLPPVFKKPKESSQQKVKKSVCVNPSPPRPVRRDGERSSMQLQPLNPSPEEITQITETGVPPSDGSNLTLSDVERRYEIGRVIGDGNFAVVRECRRRDSRQTFAVKIVERSKLIGREHMMQNELSLLGSLCHPRIVRLLAHHHTRTHSYLVMELVSGGDLFEAISERGRFSEAEAGLMVSDVSDALNYIHCRSIVHRDLKPENLLIEKVTAAICRLKLGDFGLAMVVTEPVFTICGTPTYVAPEILRETGYGVAVDVWALGVILYILLCGFAPFRSRDRDQEELFKLIKQAQLHFPSPYWDSISEEAKSLVRSLLQPDPDVRLTAEQTLQNKWVKTMASICRQRALTDKTQRNAADASTELQRVQRPAQTDAAESLTDKTAGRCGSRDRITLRRNDELRAEGRDETKPAPLQLKETSTVNATASQIREQTPLFGTGSQEKLNLTSGEQQEIQDPGPKLPITERGDLIQRGFSATESSLLESKPNSKPESPPDSPASNRTSVPNHSRSLSSTPPVVQTNCDSVSPSPTLQQQPPSKNTQLRTGTRQNATTPSPTHPVSPDDSV